MILTRFKSFLGDEQGGYTIWSLTWFILYMAIGGLAVDITDAYRNRTQLQATADAAALAGAMSLPNQTDAITKAVVVAQMNLGLTDNGHVLRPEQVTLGIWNFETRTFTPGNIEPNAVHVTTHRDDRNQNPVAMNFLRILALIGLDPRWNIVTEAIAVAHIPNCIGTGLIALEHVRIAGNNHFVNEVCIHGQLDGVSIQNNNRFDPGVYVSMGDLDDLKAKVDQNVGLDEALREGDLWPKDVERLEEIIEGLIPGADNEFTTLPDYMYTDNGDGTRTPPIYTEVRQNFSGPYEEKHVYYVKCPNSNTQLNLPNANDQPELKNVVIVAECRIHGSGLGEVESVVLASTALGKGKDEKAMASIQVAAQADLGTADGCAEGGGVDVYAYASVKLAAGGDINGLRAVVGGDFEMTANGGGVEGISVQAGQEIKLTSNNTIGSCPGNSGGPFENRYRLVL